MSACEQMDARFEQHNNTTLLSMPPVPLFDKFSRGIFFGITDFVFSFFFEPSPPHNSEGIDANTDATNNTTKTTHTTTY